MAPMIGLAGKAAPAAMTLATGVIALIFLIAGIAMLSKKPLTGIALFAVAGAIMYWGQTLGHQVQSATASMSPGSMMGM